jgi:hypothetical protein
VSRTKSANAFDDETIVLDWCLESLVAVPSHATSCIRYQCNGMYTSKILLCSLLEYDPRPKDINQIYYQARVVKFKLTLRR